MQIQGRVQFLDWFHMRKVNSISNNDKQMVFATGNNTAVPLLPTNAIIMT